jgi:hypothetical protein
MKYRVHRLEVKADTMEEQLERYLNRLKGEVVSVLPNIKPTFMGMGATARVNYLLVVEKLGN